MKSIKLMAIGLLLSGSMSFGMNMNQKLSVEQAIEIVSMQFAQALQMYEYCQKESQESDTCTAAKELIDEVMPMYAKIFKGGTNLAKELRQKFDSVIEVE